MKMAETDRVFCALGDGLSVSRVFMSHSWKSLSEVGVTIFLFSKGDIEAQWG